MAKIQKPEITDLTDSQHDHSNTVNGGLAVATADEIEFALVSAFLNY
jgi:hypothetical protein